MPKKKVEVYEKDQLIYPYIESDHVTFSNGMKVSEMLNQSISMPTVIHEDSSFKVGVGDQDVSSAIVDSSVSEMTIKGKTYQNILPEPSTHILTNDKEMFKVNEGLDPNVEIVDGVAKSAILKGQTLNNIALTINNTIHKNAGIVVTKPSLYDMAKRYIVMFDVVEKPDTLYMKLEGATDGTWKCDLSSQKLIDSVGRYYLISNVSSVQHKQIKLTNTLSSSERCIVTNVNVVEYQEGMENWDIPYFEGMQSVKMPVLTTVGKNLINLGDFSEQTKNGITLSRNNNSSIKLNGGTSSMTNFWFNNLSIKLKPDTYQFLLNHQDSNITYFFRDADGNNVIATKFSNSVVITEDKTITTLLIQVNGGVSSSNQDINIQLERSSVATPYEPYKTNILTTPEEVVLRSLPNGVKDELNLLTGEYIQRVGEIVFDGSSDEGWILAASHTGGSTRMETECISGLFVGVETSNDTPNMKCDQYDEFNFNALYGGKREGIGFYRNTHIVVHDSKYTNINSFLARLQQNPITVQYELAEPIVKTVDVSSSGNWEKVVLNGSENWARHGNYGSVTRFNVTISNMATGQTHVFSDKFPTGAISTNDLECVNNHYSANQFQLQIKTSRLASDSVDGLKQYLSQNPLTVWYQTKNHQDSTQVKQPIFFKDGHIQLSSGVDNSLIPTLDYQAKTSNSYVMDLMKTNTKYTMKAKSVSGTFTIDGTSYGVGTNGIFTTPTSMTNKFLVMSNKTNEEVMILEGDVVSKAIPYFKGIKSAFEDESKIEVLSTGKNLFDMKEFKANSNIEIISVDNNKVILKGIKEAYATIEVTKQLQPNTKYWFGKEANRLTSNSSSVLQILNSNNGVLVSRGNDKIDVSFTTDDTGLTKFSFRVNEVGNTEQIEVYNIYLYDFNSTTYEPYKSNNTKIPLLSPLRSLPDGTCDELIIDRENNKAKIIQRVGELDFSNLQYNTWNVSDSTLSKTIRFTWMSSNVSFYKVKDSSDGICDSIPYMRYNSSDIEHCRFDGSKPSAFMIWVDKSKLTSFDDKGMKKYLSTLPSTRVQYALATPIITEVDLEGFPYIYKDGHIFLNSEIAPTTEIIYSINQCQQISASNEDIIRHEKELTYLQKLIAQYIQVDYESVLLSLKV